MFQLTEKEFLLLKKGDPDAFEKLYLYFEKLVYTFLLRKTNGNRIASDIIFSDTFYSVYNSLSKLKKNNNIHGWILQIAFRRLNDYLRKEYKERKKEEFIDKNDFIKNDIADDFIQKEKIVMLNIALETLKPEFQEIIKLKYYENKSQRNIAEHFKIKETTVEGLLSRARKALKKELNKISILYNRDHHEKMD